MLNSSFRRLVLPLVILSSLAASSCVVRERPSERPSYGYRGHDRDRHDHHGRYDRHDDRYDRH